MKKIILSVIKIYQKLLSFDHSFWARPKLIRVCVHTPSCSSYTYEAVNRFGVFKGLIMGFFRVLRCHPFNKHKFDPVPEKFSIRANLKP
jgi:uncharacterized protein